MGILFENIKDFIYERLQILDPPARYTGLCNIDLLAVKIALLVVKISRSY